MVFHNLPGFNPDFTLTEILGKGVLGGTAFSVLTQKQFTELDKLRINNLWGNRNLTYDETLNHYKVREVGYFLNGGLGKQLHQFIHWYAGLTLNPTMEIKSHDLIMVSHWEESKKILTTFLSGLTKLELCDPTVQPNTKQALITLGVDPTLILPGVVAENGLEVESLTSLDSITIGGLGTSTLTLSLVSASVIREGVEIATGEEGYPEWQVIESGITYEGLQIAAAEHSVSTVTPLVIDVETYLDGLYTYVVRDADGLAESSMYVFIRSGEVLGYSDRHICNLTLTPTTGALPSTQWSISNRISFIGFFIFRSPQNPATQTPWSHSRLKAYVNNLEVRNMKTVGTDSQLEFAGNSNEISFTLSCRSLINEYVEIINKKTVSLRAIQGI